MLDAKEKKAIEEKAKKLMHELEGKIGKVKRMKIDGVYYLLAPDVHDLFCTAINGLVNLADEAIAEAED